VSDWETLNRIYHLQPQISFHLKIDTGMNRQGVRWDELTNLIPKLKTLPHLKLEGVCSHFADASNPQSDAFTQQQLKRFLEAVKLVESAGFELKWKHLSASAGALKVQNPTINLIRLGIGFYGISPLEKNDQTFQLQKQFSLQPALELRSTIAQIKLIKAGESVGYGLTYRAKKAAKIAILPIGYYDGVDRRLSNKGQVEIGGKLCPIIGAISMNMLVVDITEIKKAQVGDPAIVFSSDPHQPHSITRAAENINTIPYELLVHLAESTSRVTV
jgi:alanine racemase